jgi:hypothetical protein
MKEDLKMFNKITKIGKRLLLMFLQSKKYIVVYHDTDTIAIAKHETGGLP